jgi:hypothetical protein
VAHPVPEDLAEEAPMVGHPESEDLVEVGLTVEHPALEDLAEKALTAAHPATEAGARVRRIKSGNEAGYDASQQRLRGSRRKRASKQRG